jgi:hypothetical protein
MPSVLSSTPVVSYDLTATIANGATVSGGVDLRGSTLCGLFLPAEFDGTAVTFQACATEGGTFVPVQDGAGAAVSKTVAASQYVPLDPATFAGIQFLKVVAGTAQTGASVLTLATRPV